MRRLRDCGWLAIALCTACSPEALVRSFDFGGDEPKQFATAIANGDARRAYDLLCPGARFGISYEAFRSAVEVNPFLSTSTDVTIDSYNLIGDAAVVKKGWIESRAGVADAQFHESKIGGGFCLTGVVVGGTPALPVPGTGAAGAPLSAASAGPAARLESLPAALRNDAYRVFGLSNPATRRYLMRKGERAPEPGTQRAELVGYDAGQARFRIIRGGALGAIGSLEVVLDADGIHLVASSEGTLAAPALILPARLDPGASWKTGYLLTSPGGATTRYEGSDVVQGRETVHTPAGDFDALKLVSTATIAAGDERGTVQVRAWYADGVGSVRTESETTLDGGQKSSISIELADQAP